MAVVDIGILVTAVNNATGAIREAKGEIEGLGIAGQETANRLKAIQVVIAGIIVEKVVQLTRSFITTSAAVEILQTRLGLLTGDWQASGRMLEDIIQKYERVGISGEKLAEVFVQLRGIGQSDTQAQALVDTIGKINAATDRSPEKITMLGDALTKMLAKGTVDMRVLITVLSSQFPEAINAAATAAKATSVNAFTELAKAGQISGQQFASYLIQGINDKFGSIFQLTGGQLNTGLNRILNAWNDAIRHLNLNTPVGQELNSRLNAIADTIHRLVEQVTVDQVKSFFDTLDKMGTVAVNLGHGLAPLVPLIAAFGSAILNLFSMLPPEALLAGIFGYLFFGPLGAAAFAVIATALNKMGVEIKTGFVQDIITYMNSNEALALGTIGLVVFGPMGAAALAIIGAKLAQFRTEFMQNQTGVGGGTLPNGEPFAVAKITGGADIAAAMKNVQTAQTAINSGVGSVFDLIKQKAEAAGLSVNQTAAIIAHAKAESDLGKNLVGDNGHSFGLFQFNDKGELKALQDFAEKGGKDWMEFGTQVDFVIGRFKQLGGASTQTAEEASKVMNRFERFGDYLKNGDFGVESVNRMRSAAAILKQISEAPTTPTSTLNDPMGMEKRAQFDALKVSASGLKKQIEEINSSLNELPTQQAATKVNAQFLTLQETLTQNLHALEKMAGQFPKGSAAQNEVLVSYQQQKAILEQISGIQDQKLKREVQIATVVMSQAQMQQKILQLKADEASLTLKLNYSNNAALNLLAGTSGGQIAVQVAQQRVQLTQQIAQNEMQISQLEKEKITSTDPDLRNSIDQTIAKYRQLSADARMALANLSENAVAQKQMWGSVGAALESGAINAITALVMHTGTLKQVTLAMYSAITQAAAKYLVQLIEIQAIKPLMGAMGMGSGFSGLLGGLFAANGAVVPGGVKMFANGGIIGGPTLFGMAGEAGTEAVMPLTNIGGKLGVRSTGGGDHFEFKLSAIDTQSGVEFLLKNLTTIQAGLSQRKQLRRGQRAGGA